MLRRRRKTCTSQELSLSLGSFVRDSASEEVTKKRRKLSPFQEMEGKFVKMENEKPRPVFLKPSEVVIIEQQMANARFPDKINDGSSSSIWDNVVSWMRSAAEFIGLEATPTAGTQSRKRPLMESNIMEDLGQPKMSRPLKKGRRMSLGPGVLERRNGIREQSNEGVGLELLTTPTRAELGNHKLRSSRFCSTTSLLSSAQKYESETKGLNEVKTLNTSAVNVRIRNPSLRQYYGEGQLDQATAAVRRSPRLAALKESQDSLVPPAPPPPPPPPPPLSVPPPPPPISLNKNQSTTSSPSLSRSTLQQMQSRLRSRMMKKGGSTEEGKTPDKNTGMDLKARQWAELQAHKRKLSLEKFLALASEKKKDIDLTLKRLQSEMPSSMMEMRSVVDEVQDASQWFSGGSREMKEELPLYKSLEHKLELMTECVQIQSEMSEILSDTNPIHQRTSFSSSHTHLDLLRGEFYHRHKQWGHVLTSNGQSWHSSSLPFDQALLKNAKLYLLSVVSKYADIVEVESDKVGGVMCSIRSRRVTQVKSNLKEGLNLISEILSYCPNALDSCPCYSSSIRTSPCCMCVSGNLDRACVMSERYVKVCLLEYDGHISCLKRQEVCEHFESILKVLSSMKRMVTKFPDLSQKAKASGLMSILTSSEQLSNLLYSSCVKLIQHVESESKLIMSSSTANTRGREIVLWMMFGCKYINSVLEVIGSKQADEKGAKDLLKQLQQMEALLPD